MVAIETALARLLGMTHPILLAPMGSAAGGKLAAAVTRRSCEASSSHDDRGESRRGRTGAAPYNFIF
jgi:hypothetical protein